MRIWPALILAPLLALASISFGYALVPASCAAPWRLHVFIVVCLVASLAMTALAFTELGRAREAFLPLVATWCGAFFSLVIAAQWVTSFVLSPCTS